MVCDRCILVVRQEIERLGLHAERVLLGEVVLHEKSLTDDQLRALDKALTALGFERIDDRKARLIEGIKNKVIGMIHRQDRLDLKSNWSDILTEEFHYDYNYLSNLFSSVEGITLEQYIIRQKIERAKELLFYDELTLSQIADRLGYSNVAHLSAQFKKITGFTPSALKKAKNPVQNRKTLDNI
jgi:AraC family transcriptional regulator